MLILARCVIRLGICSFLLLCAARAEAGSVTLAWDPSHDSTVVGYTLLYGTKTGLYPGQVAVGNRTEYTITLPDGTYYFAVQAYTGEGLTSPLSNEVIATLGTITPPPSTTGTVPSTTTSSCTTPDPFASMGGGTCHDGGWLPPGMAPPQNTTTSTSATPPPSPPTTPSVPSSGSCTTPDPFAAMGGGTCYNGGWLPPGVAPPTHSPAPSTPPPTSTSPPTSTFPPPSSGTVTCTTPDPFGAMGGGTCYNGGWLPPGVVPPAQSPTPSATPPPSTSTPTAPAPPSSTGCATADPFSGMGGGTCYNGGWLPPGVAPPAQSPTPSATPPPSTSTPTAPPPPSSTGCATADPFVGMGGGTCYNGGWLPPGMAPPSGSTPSPAPNAPTPTATPTHSSPTSGGCTTPDPFAGIGGGTCYNGGWLPPGMTPQGEPARVEITVSGTLRVLSLTTPMWFIEGDDGEIYTSSTIIPGDLLIDGARISFVGVKLPTVSEHGGIVVEIVLVEIQH